MPGACTTCTGTCGSGARTGTTRTTTKTRRWTIPQGLLRAPTACSGAVAGTTLRRTAGRRTRTGSSRTYRCYDLGFRVALDVAEKAEPPKEGK